MCFRHSGHALSTRRFTASPLIATLKSLSVYLQVKIPSTDASIQALLRVILATSTTNKVIPISTLVVCVTRETGSANRLSLPWRQIIYPAVRQQTIAATSALRPYKIIQQGTWTLGTDLAVAAQVRYSISSIIRPPWVLSRLNRLHPS